MKIYPRNADAFATTPHVSSVLIYGPDQGLVVSRSLTMRESVLGNGSPDPFRYTELTVKAISSDQSILADEAAALSFTGGRRVVRVAGVTDVLSSIFEFILQQRETTDPTKQSLLIAEAGDLGPRSRLRQLFEKSTNGAALPCYAYDGNQLNAFIKACLNKLGHDVEPNAILWIGQRLAGDHALLLNELEKLSLYVGHKQAITATDTEACLGDSLGAEVDSIALATIAGDIVNLDQSLAHCFLAGQTPVSVLRAISRALLRLHVASERVSFGEQPDSVLKALKPPIFWKQVPAYRSALNRFSQTSIMRSIQLITEAELRCKQTGNPDQALAWRVAIQVASIAHKSK